MAEPTFTGSRWTRSTSTRSASSTIVDVVGTALLLDQLGIERVAASPVALGSGSARAGRGTVPVPTPAVLALLTGAPFTAGRRGRADHAGRGGHPRGDGDRMG